MRFESVTALAFGPFHDQTLEFAPGMNVVYGANEAGKSTWHAALYAGLCGRRRGPGRSREERTFAARHQPWEGSSWEVEVTLTLADDRQVRLRHDLAGGVDSSAREVNLGRDCSDEITTSGGLDGSRWLGFDRKSFLGTACVRQTAVLKVRDDAHELQDELQRAADTASTDETAAEALEQLRDFHRDQVGSDRAWTKPLLSARDALEAARIELEEASDAHADYLGRRHSLEDYDNEVARLSTGVQATSALLADLEATTTETRALRASELDAALPDGRPPADVERDSVARQVAAALQGWQARPDLPELGSPSIEELTHEIQTIDAQLAEGPAVEASADPEARQIRWIWVLAGLLSVVAGGAVLGLGWAPALGVALVLGAVVLFGWGAVGGGALRASRPDPVARPRPDQEVLRTQRIHAEHLVADRRGEQESRAEAMTQRETVAAAIARAGEAAGVSGTSTDARVASLRGWQERRESELTAADRQRQDWGDLQRVLGEETLEELLTRATELRERADGLQAVADPEAMASISSVTPTAALVEELRSQLNKAREARSSAGGQLEEVAGQLPSVAEAEEVLAAAQAEAERVEKLDATLGTTIEMLEHAEERVHRDIAPVLRKTLREWLPRVTGGRYTDCTVDPQTLEVQVSGPDGRWRPAHMLSHGTAEQLYLLLRLALAQHLTRPGEVCPLLLDDVVAACDVERKREVLETLLAISESTQVILFTHEQDVRSWADRLGSERHRFIELDLAQVSA